MYFNLFQSDKNDKWYWNLKADNHQTIATGGEGYDEKKDARHGINLVKKGAADAEIREP